MITREVGTSQIPSSPDTSVRREHRWVDIIGLLWRRRSTLLKVSALGATIALVVAFLVPSQYQATVRLMPPESGGNGAAMLAALSGGDGLGMLAGELLGGKGSGALTMAIARSRTVQDEIVEKFDLRKVYWVRYREQARKKLSERTSLSEDKKSGIVTIQVTDRDPNRVAEMAKTYVDALDRTMVNSSTSAARREREFLEQRLATVRLELNEAAQKLSEYSTKHSTIDMREQGRVVVQAVGMLQSELIASKIQLRGLEQIYAPDNVRLVSLRSRIAELEAQLKKASGTQGMGGDLPSLRQLPQLGVQYADLYRDMKVQEAVFEILTRQYELAKVEEAKSVPRVRVLDPPAVPERRSGPSRILITLGGLVLSFIAACCFVVGRSRLSSMKADERVLMMKTIAGDLRDAFRLRSSRA